jgi:sarcosine oxidase
LRVLILGAGVAGLSAAWACARAGHAVEVIDQGPIPNVGATSHDEHRLCRVPYGSQDGYARLMAPAYAAWDVLWRDVGATHYAETGCLALATGEGDWTERSRASLDRLGLGYEIVPPEALPERFPMLRTADARYGLFTRPGGVLFADRIVDALAAWCAAAGVVLRPNARAVALDPASASLTLADGSTVSGDALVACPGAFAHELSLPLPGDYRVLRQTVLYVEPPARSRAAWEAAPIMLDLGGPRGMFLAPPAGGRRMKLGFGALNRPGDPREDWTPRAGDAEAVLAAYAARLTDHAAFAPLEAKVCYYADRPGQEFHATRVGRTLLFTACSGHAFKFGALLGLGVAAALDGTDADLAWMRGDAAAFDPRVVPAT